MTKLDLSYYFRRFITVSSLLAAFLLCPSAWQERLDDWSSDVLFSIRGSRSSSNRMVLIYINAEDVKTLGGWPLTRDYYGFFLHIMRAKEAAVVAMDLLFSDRDRQYREYDAILGDYLQSNANVILPMAFSSFQKSASSRSPGYKADHPVWPEEKFLHRCAGVGFSNVSEKTIAHQLPVTALNRDSVMLSFGAEIARIYWGKHAGRIKDGKLLLTDNQANVHALPLSRDGELRLDYFDLNISSMSLVQLLQMFKNNPDSLDLKNKIVFLAATASGQAYLKNTPTGATLPASLLHATLTENILENRYLKNIPVWINAILIIIMGLSALRFGQVRERWKRLSNMFLPVVFILVSLSLFCWLHILTNLFWPLLSWIIGMIGAVVISVRSRRQASQNQHSLWSDQIEQKSAQLEEAEKQLNEITTRLTQEGQENRRLSDESARLLEEKTDAVHALEKHLRDLQPTPPPKHSSEHFDIVHAPSSKITHVLQMVKKVSNDDIPLLILGETGTGKGLVAKAVHQSGLRHTKSFLAVNCGALSETLLESELFGHEKGSFTGALGRRRGFFELADGGTLFLDEITETSPALQAKLLRVLQEKTFCRLGGEQTIRVDVRIIAAGNRDVKEQVNQGRFRSDLYYRLAGVTISLPPLRERLEDIPVLAHHFLLKHDYHRITGFSEQASTLLQQYRWPGNVRELEHAVRRAALLAHSDHRALIQVQDLAEEIAGADSLPAVPYAAIDQQILDMLRKFHFSRDAISQTARALGNKDRGTVTEYFRGLCFEYLVHANFDVSCAARELAHTDDVKIVQAVQSKMLEYIANLKKWQQESLPSTPGLPAPFRGLPKKYHLVLQQLLKAVEQKTIA